MEKSTKIYLYEKFLLNKRDSIEAINAELRIALTLLSNDLFKIGEEAMTMKSPNKTIYNYLMRSVKNIQVELTSTLQEENPLQTSVCLLIRYIGFAMNYLISYGKDLRIFEQMIKRIKEIKTEREMKEKLNLEDLIIWNGSECQNKKEQEIAFIEQRVFLQNEHKDFVKLNEKKLLKNTEMKKRMEDLIFNLKQIYFEKSEEFGNKIKIRENLIKSIPKINETTKQLTINSSNLLNRLDLWYSICAKWMDKEIEILYKKNKSLKNLILIWKGIKRNLGINLEYYKDDEGKVLENLIKEIKRMFFEIKKEKIENKIPEWLNEEINKEIKDKEEIDEVVINKFNEWLDKLVFNEFKEQVLQRDAWVDEKDGGKGFAIKLKKGYKFKKLLLFNS